MNALVFDTDIVSTFSKIRALHLLKGLFPNQEFYLPLAVREDLIAAKEAGYGFIDYLWSSELFKIVSYSEQETDLVGRLVMERTSLGSGEIACIAVAKCRHWIMVTNDTAAKNECDRQGVRFIDLSTILGSLWREAIIPKNEVEDLINQIERKDRVKIRNRKEILGE